jgi:GIY-YIG catalytic domain-containing protein
MTEIELPKDVQSTLDHLAMLSERRQMFVEREEAGRAQLIHRLGIQWRAGDVTPAQVLTIYGRIRDLNLPGFMKLWDEARLPSPQSLRGPRKTGFPNRSDGGWEGKRYNDLWPGPLEGQCVVYVLYDRENKPCYVGSSGQLQNRISAHRQTKQFDYWIAWPCEDRKAAYVRESQMLQEYAPYLNKRTCA